MPSLLEHSRLERRGRDHVRPPPDTVLASPRARTSVNLPRWTHGRELFSPVPSARGAEHVTPELSPSWAPRCLPSAAPRLVRDLQDAAVYGDRLGVLGAPPGDDHGTSPRATPPPIYPPTPVWPVSRVQWVLGRKAFPDKPSPPGGTPPPQLSLQAARESLTTKRLPCSRVTALCRGRIVAGNRLPRSFLSRSASPLEPGQGSKHKNTSTRRVLLHLVMRGLAAPSRVGPSIALYSPRQ